MNGFLKFGKVLSKETMKAITGKSGHKPCYLECNCAGTCHATQIASYDHVEQACTSLCATRGGWNGVCTVSCP